MGHIGSIWERQLSRRTFGLAAAGALGAMATGCSSAAPAAAPDRAANSASAAATGAFPVTLEHAYGSTTVEQEPTRVASVGYSEQDFLLALGVVPVAVTDWYGDQPYATWPWARAALGDARPTVLKLSDGFQFLEIAKTRPDLIVGMNSGMERGDFTKLAKIGPTLAHAKADAMWFAPWPDLLAPIAAAVGKAAEGDRIAAAVKQKFTDAAAANPAFAGKKVVFLQNAVYDGNLLAYQKGLSTEFLTDLGFDVPAEIDEFVKDGAQAYIPVEKIGVLNAADVLVWGTEKDEDRAALEKVPGFSSLNAVKNGASIYTGGELAGAIYFASPLSLPYVVDTLVPMLAAVVRA